MSAALNSFRGAVGPIFQREQFEVGDTSFCVHLGLLGRYGQVGMLEGHEGCVNRIAWNSEGSLLVSGSDDCCIRIWNPHMDQDRSCVHTIGQGDTGHVANIFGVSFLPFSQDRKIVSGAMDGKVILHDIEYPENRKIYTCHSNRVKYVETHPSEPNLFWSASEDSSIRQFDIREHHRCSSVSCSNAIVDLSSSPQSLLSSFFAPSGGCPFKCIAVNPLMPMQIAASSDDAQIRVFDRRKPLPDRSKGVECVFKTSPYHLRLESLQEGEDPDAVLDRSIHCTYLTYSPTGEDILATYNGGQTYLFSVGGGNRFNVDRVDKPKGQEIYRYITSWTHTGDTAFYRKEWIKAVSSYSLAIRQIYKTSSISKAETSHLYSKRAEALLQRGFYGDLYLALYDAEKSILLHPENHERHITYLDTLKACALPLKWETHLEKCISQFPQLKGFVALQRRGYGIPNGPVVHAHRLSDETPFLNHKKLEPLKMSYCGALNMQTDIKEANFFANGEYIVAASDDHHIYVWETRSGELVKIVNAGTAPVNCVRPNPHSSLLATSGIESEIRLFDAQSQKTKPFPDGSFERIERNQAMLEQGATMSFSIPDVLIPLFATRRMFMQSEESSDDSFP